MEEMAQAVAVPFRLGNSICDNSAIAAHMETTRLKLVTDTANLLSNPTTKAKLSVDSTEKYISGVDDDCSCGNQQSKVGIIAMIAPEEAKGRVGLLKTLRENESSWVASDVVIQENEEDDSLSVVDHILVCSCSGDEFIALGSACETGTPSSMDIEKSIGNVKIIPKDANLVESNVDQKPMGDLLAVATGCERDAGDGFGPKESGVVPLTQDKRISRTSSRSVFELECVPLWGFTSICGRRAEMEDAVAAAPRFLEIPIQMLISHRLVNGMTQNLSHVTAHFFGVYDGHGGSQVANYCRDRIHSALVEEIESIKETLGSEGMKDNLQMQWEKAFTGCFLKVDAEVGGRVGRGSAGGNADTSEASLEPVAPETVGSTAVVAVICSSHIIVANCGDSRAVMCRGKEPMPLSVDHKPSREDEYARIEAAGGKVIQWNGYRVFGVLAMSRSIGISATRYLVSFFLNNIYEDELQNHMAARTSIQPDSQELLWFNIYEDELQNHMAARTSIEPDSDRYLKPWIIPEPEVMIIARAKDDECLILASDGLWDVMTNEEACDVARRRILLWHKKNGGVFPSERGEGVDPAAQVAAECLSKLALQRGSKDNITVIVVDLKPQRKFKSKT